MAIDSNDQQITSEMSRRFEHFNINDQEYHDAYESAPIDDCWSSESTYVSGFQLDPTGEANEKSGFYISESMHAGAIFDPILTIQDKTDIGSEGSSVYPGQSQETTVNWALVDVAVIVSISDL